MAEPAPAPVPRGGFLASMALAVFNWLTSPGEVPWAKFVVLLVCGVLGLTGAIAWDQRTVFVTVWARNEEVTGLRLSRERAAQLLPALMRRTGAVAAAVWEYDFPSNARTLVLAQDARGKALLEGVDVTPIFRGANAPAAPLVSAMFVGQVPCGLITDNYAPDTIAIRNATGAALYCIAAVNSVFGEMRGSLVAFFATEPDRESVAVAMRATAMELVRSKEH